MKKLLTLIFVGLLSLVGAQKAMANEGYYQINGVGDYPGRCVMMSVLTAGDYRVLATCRDLITPQTGDLDRYVAWSVTEEGDTEIISEVVRGKFDSSVYDPFVEVLITAESKSQPREPGLVVMRGRGVNLFSESIAPVMVEQGQEPVSEVTPTPVVTKAPGIASGLGVAQILGAVGRVVLIALVVLFVGVVALTVITRRKGSI